MPVHLYRYSLREAKEHDEVQNWKQSHAENIRCRDAIDRMVSERYRNSILTTDIIKDAFLCFVSFANKIITVSFCNIASSKLIVTYPYDDFVFATKFFTYS